MSLTISTYILTDITSLFLNTNQQLVGGKDKAVDNINLNGGYSKEDMEMKIIPNDSEDFPGQKNHLFDHGNASYGTLVITLRLMTHLVFNIRLNVHLQSIFL